MLHMAPIFDHFSLCAGSPAERTFQGLYQPRQRSIFACPWKMGATCCICCNWPCPVIVTAAVAAAVTRTTDAAARGGPVTVAVAEAVAALYRYFDSYCPIQSLRCNDQMSRDGGGAATTATTAATAAASLDGCHSSSNGVFPAFRARQGHGADAVQRDEVENRPGKWWGRGRG